MKRETKVHTALPRSPAASDRGIRLLRLDQIRLNPTKSDLKKYIFSSGNRTHRIFRVPNSNLHGKIKLPNEPILNLLEVPTGSSTYAATAVHRIKKRTHFKLILMPNFSLNFTPNPVTMRVRFAAACSGGLRPPPNCRPFLNLK